MLRRRLDTTEYRNNPMITLTCEALLVAELCPPASWGLPRNPLNPPDHPRYYGVGPSEEKAAQADLERREKYKKEGKKVPVAMQYTPPQGDQQRAWFLSKACFDERMARGMGTCLTRRSPIHEVTLQTLFVYWVCPSTYMWTSFERAPCISTLHATDCTWLMAFFKFRTFRTFPLLRVSTALHMFQHYKQPLKDLSETYAFFLHSLQTGF